MALEITDGMAYIAKQRVVHGDLAARNCMINSHNMVKIGDFGLSHDVYTKGYFRKDDKVIGCNQEKLSLIFENYPSF